MHIGQLKTIICDKKITFRLLKGNDYKILINFFANLSEDMKAWYNPHLFDEKTAIEICNNKDKKQQKIIGICDNEIISYCQLFFGLRHWEKMRFEKRGIFFNDEDVSTIAPCVIEEWQGSGVSLKMMDYVIDVCRQYGKKYILLWGGVVVKNKKAVNYYKKLNFKSSKKWLHPLKKVMSYDMYLEI